MASKTIFSLFLTLFFSNPLLQTRAAETVVKAAYWFPDSEFPVPDIDSRHFTHLFCAFADLNNRTNQVTIAPANIAKFSTFSETIRRRNPSVKAILSIGGGSANKTDYASMASKPSSRKSFIDSSIKLARTHKFHGLDLDWEYPSTTTEMANFGALLNEWRSAVNRESQNSGRPPLLLAAAVFYSSDHYSIDYPVNAIARSLDWINVMAYDFYGPGWSKVTGPPAALRNPQDQVSGDSGISAWIRAGMPSKKIVLGFPFFGYAWRLSDPNNHGYFAPTTGAATGEDIFDGSIGYKQIRRYIVKNRAVTVHDSSVVGDYCYSGRTWIGYDDFPSIVEKVRYAKQGGLLGYFAWHVGVDDTWGLSSGASREWDRGLRYAELIIKQTVEETLE